MFDVVKVEKRGRKIPIPDIGQTPIVTTQRLIVVGNMDVNDSYGNPMRVAQDVTRTYEYGVWITFAMKEQKNFTNAVLYLLDEQTAYECLDDEFREWFENIPPEAFEEGAAADPYA